VVVEVVVVVVVVAVHQLAPLVEKALLAVAEALLLLPVRQEVTKSRCGWWPRCKPTQTCCLRRRSRVSPA
jgi:hypothetical protein